MKTRLALALLVALVASAPVRADRFTPGRAESSGKDDGAPKPRPRLAWRPGDGRVTQELDAEPLAVVGADIHPVVGPVVPGGTLLLKHGRIEAILPAERDVPGGYRVVDGRGLQAWPGYVAAGADGLGLADDAYAGGQDAQMARGLGESFDAWSDQVELAASAGITTALVWRDAAEPRGPLAGRAAIFKMSVREPRGALVSDTAAAVASPGILGPDARAQLRASLTSAREEGAPKKPDARKELWRALARKDAPLLAQADSAGDIAGLLDLAKEADLRLLLVTPAEAWPLAERLAAADVGVVQNVRYSWGKPRADRRGNLPGGWRYDAPAILTHAGVTTAIAPDSATISLWGVAGRDLLDLPLEAAYGVRGGLTQDEAIRAITIVPAELLGIEERVGSLEPGKDADVILLDGDPLDYRTIVRTTIVNGRVAQEAEKSRYWNRIARRRVEALEDRSQYP